MILARTQLHGAQGREELLARAAAFRRGEGVQLLAAARRPNPLRKQGASIDAEAMAERKREQACAKVRKGELSRARSLLTAAELAPGNEGHLASVQTPLAALRDHARQCRPTLQTTSRAIPPARPDCRCSSLAGCEARRSGRIDWHAELSI